MSKAQKEKPEQIVAPEKKQVSIEKDIVESVSIPVSIADLLTNFSEADFIANLVERIDSGSFYQLDTLREILVSRQKKLA